MARFNLMRVSAPFFSALVLGAAGSAGQPPPKPEPPAARNARAADVAKQFKGLAADLRYFPTEEIAGGRATLPAERLVPKDLTDHWKKVFAGLESSQADVADVLPLLKHDHPNVRALALAFLFERQDPRLLPHFAALQTDGGYTAPDVVILRAVPFLPPGGVKLEPGDYRPQAVGDVAKAFLRPWVESAGYYVKDFAAYWEARKDRPFCASWFAERLQHAGQHTTAFDARRGEPLLRALRKDIDALPAPDRDWELLAVGAQKDTLTFRRAADVVATPKDLLAAGKRLGPERLMDLLRDKDISSDPDLAAKETPPWRGTRLRRNMDLWVLRNAGQLLRPADAPTLLELEKALPDHTPWGAIAAAELQPDRAREWLHAAMGRYAGDAIQTHLAWHRAELAAALWRVVGVSEIPYLADWFYGESVATNPHSTQTEHFLELVKGVRAPADRKLAARLVTDPRLDRLDYQSLRALVGLVSGWTKAPVVEAGDVRPNWERGTSGPETEGDRARLAQWRDRLRASVKEWAAAPSAPAP